MYESIVSRLKRKVRANQLVIAVGNSSSKKEYSIANLAEEIIKDFKIDFSVENRAEYFKYWNDLVNKAEKIVTRKKLIQYVSEKVSQAKPSFTHRMIAAIPISNFVDTTFDRSLYKALLDARRNPIAHDWGRSQQMGIWKQSNIEAPSLFFMLPNLEDDASSWGIYEPTRRSKSNRIQIENIKDMLSGRDLVLINYNANEAEYILNLSSLVMSCEKIFNFADEYYDLDYWAMLGVCLVGQGPEDFISRIVPYGEGRYSNMDVLIAGTPIIEAVTRLRQYDCFVSYCSSDEEFVVRLERDLRQRGIEIWRDRRETEIGDSILDKIRSGISESYTFIIVLSPESLKSEWVIKELNEALAKSSAGEIRIHPVLHKDCPRPPQLDECVYADFRDSVNYDKEIELLTKAIENSIRRMLEKK